VNHCPKCDGEVIVVGKRAWCVARYSAGGCGTTWSDWDRRRELITASLVAGETQLELEI